MIEFRGMPTPMDVKHAAIKEVLSKEQKLTADDLQVLRKSTEAANLFSTRTDYFVFRTEVELIDAIRALDETSAKLIRETNKLTARIFWLTIVGVIIAAIGVAVAVLQLLHFGPTVS